MKGHPSLINNADGRLEVFLMGKINSGIIDIKLLRRQIGIQNGYH